MAPPHREAIGEALLRCAKAAAWSEGVPLPADLPAPDALVEAARAEHALSVAGRALRAAPACPAPLRAELERIDRGAWATHVVTAAALGPVLADAAAEGIEVAVYKGAAIAARYYDEPWTRAMTDVDALIAPRDAPRFHALLDRHGFAPLPSPAGRAWTVRASHERTFAPAAPGARLIDVHTAPAQPARYPLPAEEMLARGAPGRLFDAPVRFLSPADELLVLAANQAHDHYRFGLLRYLDAWLVIERAAVDWEGLIGTARAAGVASAAWLTLANARRLAGAAVPDQVLARLAPSPLRRRWLRAALDLQGSGAPRRALPRRLEQLVLLYPTLDRPRDLVRFAAVHGALRALDAGTMALGRLRGS